jgi:hypothetical protein
MKAVTQALPCDGSALSRATGAPAFEKRPPAISIERL